MRLILCRIWAFLAHKKNRDIIAWAGAGVVTIVGGVWTYFHNLEPAAEKPQPNSALERCFEGITHPNAPQLVLRYLDYLTKDSHVYGWKGGAANNGDSSKRFDSIVTDVVANKDRLHIHYAYQNGLLILKPVMPRIASGSPWGLFEGSWLQDNGGGCVSLFFETTMGTARGSWSANISETHVNSNYISIISNTPSDAANPLSVSDNKCQFESVNLYVQHAKNGGKFNAPVCERDRRLIFRRCVELNGGKVHGSDEFQKGSCCHHLTLNDQRDLRVCGR